AVPLRAMNLAVDNVRKLAKGEASVAAEIPLGALVAPDVCKLRGKTMYCATWRIAGVPFETSTPASVAAKLDYLASVYRHLGGGELSYWLHRTCRIVDAQLSHDAFSGFAAAIDQRYSAWQTAWGYALVELPL